MEASAPLASHIEPEPREWQLRALWVGARMLCGAAAFFFMAFLFAYFYLRSLDVNKSWKIGTVDPPTGWGVAIVVVLVAERGAVADGVQATDECDSRSGRRRSGSRCSRSCSR